MTTMTLRLTLKSAATFGRGGGVAGLLDREVEHDRDGFPYLRGKTLKGLLVEAAENIVYALLMQGQRDWSLIKDKLFGQPGRGLVERGILHVGNAELPQALRKLIKQEHSRRPTEFRPEDVLYSLTAIRHQTAMNPEGGPEYTSLRAMRVILPGVELEASLHFARQPSEQEQAFLAATVLDLRRAGTGRNRGRGRLQTELEDAATTRRLFEQFAKAVQS